MALFRRAKYITSFVHQNDDIPISFLLYYTDGPTVYNNDG